MPPKPPSDSDSKLEFIAAANGIVLEHVTRTSKHDMKVKHFHAEYEIFFILEGSREFFFNNRTIVAKKGDLILIDSNMIHMTKTLESGDPYYSRIILYIPPAQLRSLDERYLNIRMEQFFHEYYGIYHISSGLTDYIMQLYHVFQQEYSNIQPLYQKTIELAVTQFLLQLYRECHVKKSAFQKKPDERNRYIYEIAEYLEQNYKTPPSLDELADRFFLSKYHICRSFKAVTGYNIREFINVHRIRNAVPLLETSDAGIAEIAEAVGYDSLTHFEKVFKSYLNMTPIQYRKSKSLS